MLASLSNWIGRPPWLRPRSKNFASRANEWLVQEHRPIVTYVGRNRVLVSVRVGPHRIAYYVESDDRLLSPWFIATGEFETDLTKFFLRNLRRDSHCIDVGANFGYYSCLMARHCPDGRVLGIEADRKVADLARDNLFINGLQGSADIVCAAASDSDKGMTLYRRVSRSGNASMVDVGHRFSTQLGEPPAEPFTVRSVRIDELADGMGGRIDFIKIDVEGAEPLVLAGAKETIRRNRDIAIVMEWSPGQISAAGFDIDRFPSEIANLGLCCFSLHRDQERPIENGMLAKMPYQSGIILRRKDAG